ncbi:MAG TPA: peptidase dimerization domain-containing protein [Thermoanaerobaculia bacterium]|nr:peptidase dimerization domain-containing protein [Thermoanaerobaculia bacterium]
MTQVLDATTTRLDEQIATLAQRYRGLAVQILREAIRIPADFVDKDPKCGLSGHELPRLEYLKRTIVDVGAVEHENDVWFDDFGNLCWVVQDKSDGIKAEEKTVVMYDGHTDTVNALRSRWHEAIGGGIDPYLGWVDGKKVDREFLSKELGFLPPESEWNYLVWGRGAADQLAGVVSQIVATKVLLETKREGSLRGVIVRSFGTISEEDNDGGSPMYLVREVYPKAKKDVIPDAVIITEGTGCAHLGAVGIYRGQRGRMQIEVEVTGKSCHGSMPWEGRNPLEYGAAMIVEAADLYRNSIGFAKDEFLGGGTRTASWATLATPSDCAVPERFTFRFDRRLTAGEDPDRALQDIKSMSTVAKAIGDGLRVDVRAPSYDDPTWRGYRLHNPQIYPGWVTPEDHPSIPAAVDAFKRVSSPVWGNREPRVARWIFSTDGVGFPTKTFTPPASKKWIRDGAFTYPAILGIGPGIEQNTHKVGECMDSREFPPVVAFLARFPTSYRARRA